MLQHVSKQIIDNLSWLILDVDGVLTDGSISLAPNNDEIKTFNVKDGFALNAWKRAGFKLAIITGRSGQAVTIRAQSLGFDVVMRGVKDKGKAIYTLSEEHEFDLQHVAYIGDDLPDLPALALCGLSIAPADAAVDLIHRVQWNLENRGGHGAVREAVEAIMRHKGIWDEVNLQYLS